MEFTKDGRKLRPRKSVAGSAANSEKVEYHTRERRESSTSTTRRDGEHRTYSNGTGERKSFGGRKPYGERGNSGEHSSYGERKPYGEHKAYGAGDHKPAGRRSFGEDSGERRSFGEHKSFGDRKPYGSGEHKPAGRRSFGEGPGERKPYGERKAYGGPRKSFDGAPYGEKPFRKRSNAQFTKESDEGIERMISRRPGMDSSKYSDFDNAASPIKDEIRLNKFIANSGVCSRREADTLIQAGVVTVNGEVVTELGTKVNIFKDEIKFNGETLKGEEKVYIVMNKPKGFVTTASDPHADKTVMDLLKSCQARVYPVGRLDKNTTGVLMFTNDGEMSERLTHPSYDKKKIYQVILDRELAQADFESILSGITLDDGDVAADELEYIDENDHRKLGIEIHSGKNRIVRRIFESLGYDVRALDRVYFAGLTKKGLKKGEWRFLTEGEVNILKMGAYI